MLSGMSQDKAQQKLLLTAVPIAKTGMLIRKPPETVFEALVNPDVTTQFWFTRGSGPLKLGKIVRWYWDMYDFSIEVTPKAIDPGKHIEFEWPGHGGPTKVEWKLRPTKDGTFVEVQESGFRGSGDELVKYVADSTQGFSLVLAGMKAYLEHGVRLNLVRDRYPDGITRH